MSDVPAQLWLTLILLTSATVFVLLDEHNLAVGLVGAVLGQGAAVGVNRAANGNGGKE